MTDVSGNARGMFVCGSMNPWQQNNEHKQRGDKQRGDKQRRSAPARLCLRPRARCVAPLQSAIQGLHSKATKEQKTRIYSRKSEHCKQNIKGSFLLRDDEAGILRAVKVSTPDVGGKKIAL